MEKMIEQLPEHIYRSKEGQSWRIGVDVLYKNLSRPEKAYYHKVELGYIVVMPVYCGDYYIYGITTSKTRFSSQLVGNGLFVASLEEAKYSMEHLRKIIKDDKLYYITEDLFGEYGDSVFPESVEGREIKCVYMPNLMSEEDVNDFVDVAIRKYITTKDTSRLWLIIKNKTVSLGTLSQRMLHRFNEARTKSMTPYTHGEMTEILLKIMDATKKDKKQLDKEKRKDYI